MYRAAIITLSDKGARGEREDLSGQVIADMLVQAGYEVVQRLLLSDDRQGLTDALKRICDNREAELILTTGGTGFPVRDNAPEATMDAIERPVPGIAEALRMNSLRFTPRGMLSPGGQRHPQGYADHQPARQPQGRAGESRIHSAHAGTRHRHPGR